MRKILRVALLALMATLAACGDPRFDSPDFKVRYATADERRDTLANFERAWSKRPIETSVQQSWYERRLIARAAFFGRKIKWTETYKSACSFWADCQREHIDRYDDDPYKDDDS